MSDGFPDYVSVDVHLLPTANALQNMLSFGGGFSRKLVCSVVMPEVEKANTGDEMIKIGYAVSSVSSSA